MGEKEKNEALANIYRKEYKTLTDMRLCARRYLMCREVDEEQRKIDERIIKDMDDLYNKYIEKLNKKFYKKTGKALY